MAVLRQTLSDTLTWAIERIEQERWDVQKIKVHLALP
jgi:hypothetical protein